ncbi:hypothetical protein CXZ10_16610 [Pleomorphomonas diazotrophica]|uniref:Secreted protein n=2 Tax=Pleomorphomonas diazotrophica TaxID=1166257 RepID=A0A2N3LU06_9HYPH|nr:hypothetical protein CXZ10_16610 [Pleomorphomonas diazotrophica]
MQPVGRLRDRAGFRSVFMRVLFLALLLALFANTPAAFAADRMPAYADLLADCTTVSEAACPGQQTALAPQWPKALAGNLQALRNFAFCFADGCYGAFKVNPVRACALRIVVAAIGERPIPDEDSANFERDCGPLGVEDQQTAKVAARDMVRAIRQGTP